MKTKPNNNNTPKRDPSGERTWENCMVLSVTIHVLYTCMRLSKNYFLRKFPATWQPVTSAWWISDWGSRRGNLYCFLNNVTSVVSCLLAWSSFTEPLPLEQKPHTWHRILLTAAPESTSGHPPLNYSSNVCWTKRRWLVKGSKHQIQCWCVEVIWARFE